MSSRTKTRLYLFAAILSCLPIGGYMATRWYVGFMWDVSCGQHLKRAADANTVEIAAKELDAAITYLEVHGQTEGYTTIFKVLWLPPNEDIGFWYNNLRASCDELRAFRDQKKLALQPVLVPEEGHLKRQHDAAEEHKRNTQEQQAMLLLKLRETLLDHTAHNGETITCPAGIAFYPNNVSWCVTGLVLGIIAVIGCGICLIKLPK